MAWANQEIYKEIKKLDTKVLDYFVIDPEWTVRTIMVHIAGASHSVSYTHLTLPTSPHV